MARIISEECKGTPDGAHKGHKVPASMRVSRFVSDCLSPLQQ